MSPDHEGFGRVRRVLKVWYVPQPIQDSSPGRGEYEERELSRKKCPERVSIPQTE